MLTAAEAICLSAGCGGGSSPGASYAEYDCGGRIGKIVRDDCSKNAIKYDGTIFESSVSAPVVGGAVSYRENATREASELVQLLNQQSVRLCEDFNSCRLTVPEYNGERRKLDDSYVALTALKGQMAQLDAEQASKLLAELAKIRQHTTLAKGNACAESWEVPFTKDPNSECAAPWNVGVDTCMRGQSLHAAWTGDAEWQGFGVPLRAGWSGFLDLTKFSGCSVVLRVTGKVDEVHVVLKGQECEQDDTCNQSEAIPLSSFRTPTGEFRIPLAAFEGRSLPFHAAKQIVFGTWRRRAAAEIDVEFPIRIE